MNTENSTEQAHTAWTIITLASTADQPAHYWSWCKNVIASQRGGKLTIKEAASLLAWPKSVESLEGLESSADVMIVIDTADDIAEGSTYLGRSDEENKAWINLTERVSRHVSDI